MMNLHLQLHLLLCATRQPFSLLRALDCPKGRGGLRRVANRPAAARMQRWRKGCWHDRRFAFAFEATLSHGSGGAAQTELGRQ